MRVCKFFHNCIAFFMVFSLFFNTYAEASVLKQENNTPIEEKDIFNIKTLSLEKILDFILNLEEELEKYTDEELEKFTHLIVNLARKGSLIDDRDADVLENDIQELLSEEFYPDYYFNNCNDNYVIEPSIFKYKPEKYKPEILLYKSWFKKNTKKVGKFFKKHKKKIIIASVAVISVVTGIALIKKAKSNKPKEELPSEDTNNSSILSYESQDKEILKEIIDEKIFSEKEIALESGVLNSKDDSFKEKAKDFGAHLAHETLDELSNVASFIPKLEKEIIDAVSSFLPEKAENLECSPMENYEKSVDAGHKAIDKIFSTNLSENYTIDAKNNIEKLKPKMVIGYLPYPSGILKNIKSIPSIATKKDVLNIIKPKGRWIGKKGADNYIRLFKGGQKESIQVFDKLTKNAKLIKNSSYPGKLYILEDGTKVGFRALSKSGPPTIDLDISGYQNNIKLKFLEN